MIKIFLLNQHNKTKEFSVISKKSICAIKSQNILKEAIKFFLKRFYHSKHHLSKRKVCIYTYTYLLHSMYICVHTHTPFPHSFPFIDLSTPSQFWKCGKCIFQEANFSRCVLFMYPIPVYHSRLWEAFFNSPDSHWFFCELNVLT